MESLLYWLPIKSAAIDAGLSQQRWRVSVDFRDEGAERSASEKARRFRRRPAPAHAQNLCQEAGLDDAREARHAIGTGMVQQRGDPRVADAQPPRTHVTDRPVGSASRRERGGRSE